MVEHFLLSARRKLLFSCKQIKGIVAFSFFLVAFMSRKNLIVGQVNPKALFRTVSYIFLCMKNWNSRFTLKLLINIGRESLLKHWFVICKEDVYWRLGWTKWSSWDIRCREKRLNVSSDHTSLNFHEMLVSQWKSNDPPITASRFALCLRS